MSKKQKQEKQQLKGNVTKKPINKKVVIPIVILIIVILIGTLVIFAVSKNKTNVSENTVQETKARNINLEDNEYMHVELDANNEQIPVPNGYVGSKATGENEIDSGYVIYEGTDEVNDSNVVDAQKNRNQYVWIPVPDTSKFYGTDSNGKKWGKIYSFSTNTSSDYDQVTGTKPNNWSENGGVIRITTKTGSTSYREPDVVTAYDTDSQLKSSGLGTISMHELQMQMEQEFNRMIASVEKYGGFYIGRYETGNVSQDVPVIRKGNTDINYITWYDMYKKGKKIKGNNTNVETGMIWGNQWDRTLMWLIESGNKTKEEICNSTSWGNYSNNTEPGHGSRQSTGYSETWKANNIYDLAGNVSEWTMEAYDTGYRVNRGGYYGSDGSDYPASYRYYGYSPIFSYSYIGARGALYIK